MASRYRTSRREEALLASSFVSELAAEVLGRDGLNEADQVAFGLVSTKPRVRAAIAKLQFLVAPPPKRPLYYAQYELQYLPRWTRDAIRDLGDYVDELVKHWAYVVTGDKKVYSKPIGACLQIIEVKGDESHKVLLDWLRRYNSFLYRPAKHDFHLPNGRTSHRFTSREAVYMAFLTMNLAGRVKEITQCLPELTCHEDTGPDSKW